MNASAPYTHKRYTKYSVNNTGNTLHARSNGQKTKTNAVANMHAARNAHQERRAAWETTATTPTTTTGTTGTGMMTMMMREGRTKSLPLRRRRRGSSNRGALTTCMASKHELLAAAAADPMTSLLSKRVVFLAGQVDDVSADAVISQLLLLDSQDSTSDIRLYINSPGGSVTAGMGIYDAMQLCRADVSTVCFGLAASMGAMLLCSGAAGKRYAMPNARIMIHQPLGGAQGTTTDMEIQAREILYHKANLNTIMSYHTGQSYMAIEEDTDRDFFMSPLEAKEYGLIDGVVGGDDAGLKLKGSTKKFGKKNVKHVHLTWYEDLKQGNRRTLEKLKERRLSDKELEDNMYTAPRSGAFNPEPVIPYMNNLYDDEEEDGVIKRVDESADATEAAPADSSNGSEGESGDEAKVEASADA